MKRFLMAIVAAPLAGGAAAFLAGVILGTIFDRKMAMESVRASWAIAFWAVIICAVYTLIVGLIAFIYSRIRHRPPTLTTAIVIAIAVGVIPWTVASWNEPTLGGKFALPALAALCAVATSWTFWRVAFGPRTSGPQPADLRSAG